MSRAGDDYRGGGGRGRPIYDDDRYIYERDTYEERRRSSPPPPPRSTRGPSPPRSTRGTSPPRMSGGRGGGFRERDVDEIYESRVQNGKYYEDDRRVERTYYDDPPPPASARERYGPGPLRGGGREEVRRVEVEKEREVYREPLAPRRAPAATMPRPGMIRRTSSMDAINDRRPLRREFYERDVYGPPAMRRDDRYAPALPRYREAGPLERYREPAYPERVIEREVIRMRRPSVSPSRESYSSRSSSVSSASSEETTAAGPKKFPRPGKTRMPAKLVSVKAVVDLGYPYEREGNVIIILKALGPDNIDELLKLSEIYKKQEAKAEQSSSRSQAGDARSQVGDSRSQAGEVIEERTREEVEIDMPTRGGGEVDVKETKKTYIRRTLSPPRSSYGRSRSAGPTQVREAEDAFIVDVPSPYEVVDRRLEVVEKKEKREREPRVSGALVVVDRTVQKRRDEDAIRAEIRALEKERDAMRREKESSTIVISRADLIRQLRQSGELVVYEERRGGGRERSKSRDRGLKDEIKHRERGGYKEDVVVVKKNNQGKQARAVRTLLKSLT